MREAPEEPHVIRTQEASQEPQVARGQEVPQQPQFAREDDDEGHTRQNDEDPQEEKQPPGCTSSDVRLGPVVYLN